MWKFKGSIKKSGISKGGHKKFMWNFHGSWFLTLEFPPKGCHTILQNSHGWKLVFEGWSDKSKNSRGFFQKSICTLNPPVWCFSGIAQYSWKEVGSALHVMSPARLPRSDLPSLIQPRCPLHCHQSGKFAN